MTRAHFRPDTARRGWHNAHSSGVLAFPKSAAYGAAITKPLPPLWKRFFLKLARRM